MQGWRTDKEQVKHFTYSLLPWNLAQHCWQAGQKIQNAEYFEYFFSVIGRRPGGQLAGALPNLELANHFNL